MTVDVVILTIADGQLSVLLVRRGGAPFKDHWALPGGFKRPDETLDRAARRELHEEAGLDAPAHLAQLQAYGDPGRDERTNVVSIAYLAVARDLAPPTPGGDATEAKLFPVHQALATRVRLAFDHKRILNDAVGRLGAELEHSGLATAFVGPTFTLSELRSVYETVWGMPLDAANFRRSLISSEARFVEPTGQTAPPGPEGGRPPELFRSTPSWNAGSPVKRSRKRSTDD
ncbi:MAG: NUDIX hydrolase [Ilumatobacteraceae bacterium]